MKEIIQSETMKKLWKNAMLYHKAKLISLIANEDSVFTLRSSSTLPKDYPFYTKDGSCLMNLLEMITQKETINDEAK